LILLTLNLHLYLQVYLRIPEQWLRKGLLGT